MQRLLTFFGLYLVWLSLAGFATLGGLFVVMLVADWSLASLLASGLVWPLMGLAVVLGLPMAWIGFGRVYLYSAVGGGLLFNLLVLIL